VTVHLRRSMERTNHRGRPLLVKRNRLPHSGKRAGTPLDDDRVPLAACEAQRRPNIFAP
jgi:hypothetical protein